MDQRRLDLLDERIRAARAALPDPWVESPVSEQDPARRRWIAGWMFVVLGLVSLVSLVVGDRLAGRDAAAQLLAATWLLFLSLRHRARPWIVAPTDAGSVGPGGDIASEQEAAAS